MRQPPPESLRELYVDRRYGQVKLAEHFGVDRHQIRLWLAAIDAPKRPPGGGGRSEAAPSRAVLRRLYEDEDLTIAEVARRFGVGRSTVRTWLIDHEIPRRRRRHPNQGLAQRIPPPPRADLVELYAGQRLSAEQVAARYGVSGQTVGRWLDELEVPRRPGPTSQGARNHVRARAERVTPAGMDESTPGPRPDR